MRATTLRKGHISRPVSLAILGVGLLAVTAMGPAKASPTDDRAAPIYDFVVTPNVMVPMRDGVRLATDIYWPARNGERVAGKWPVILYRVPYGTPHPERHGEYFARRGYVFLAQDARGRFDSEGVYRPFSRQDLGRDGYDAAVWAAKQEWSTGKVGTWGGSYSGLTQITLAAENPPGLAAQVIRQTFHTAYLSGFYQGGAFRLRRIPWLVNMAATSHEAGRDSTLKLKLEAMGRDVGPWIKDFPVSLRRGASPLALLPNYEEFLAGGIENERYGPYWRDYGLDVERDWERYPDVPILYFGSWYDLHSLATPELYNNLRRRHKTPQKLIFGPWLHGQERMEESFSGDVEFGPEAASDILAMHLRWYDQFLKGVDTGLLNEPPIRIFVMGGGDGRRTPEGRMFHGGQWRFEHEWPLARTRYTRHYLAGGGGLRSDPPRAAAPTTFVHDPENPVPTVGGPDAFQPWTRAGGFDQRDRNGVPLRQRPDVVVFQSPPLVSDVEITGPITVKLYASSSATNTDFAVKLLDVCPPNQDWPDGFELNLTDGILRASHRNSVGPPAPLTPGRVYELTIVVPPVSNLFKRGHRIRVDIASSNFPRFDVNRGIFASPWQRQGSVKAENRIYHDPERPSHILLPVIPR